MVTLINFCLGQLLVKSKAVRSSDLRGKGLFSRVITIVTAVLWSPNKALDAKSSWITMQQFFCVDQWTLESIKCQKIVTNTFYLFPEANVTSCLTCFTQKAEEVKKKIMLGISA